MDTAGRNTPDLIRGYSAARAGDLLQRITGHHEETAEYASDFRATLAAQM
jgi:hypothetical protein